MEPTKNNIHSNFSETEIALEKAAVWKILETVSDPEVPVLSVVDLGVVRDVLLTSNPSVGNKGLHLEIKVTPTYTGCPAMDVMKMNIRMALMAQGYQQIQLTQELSPAWTTDWMSEAGKQKLKAYGIAPPQYKQVVCTPDSFQEEEAIQCPLCNSWHTKMVSQFGSTACKALYQCEDCKEPFDYFKCH